MNDKKVYYSFIVFVIAIITVMSYARAIFPIMQYDEYFIDKNGIIHNKSCPYKSIPWFSKKFSKYDFMKENQQEFCNECFIDEEIEKLMILSEINLDNEALRLKQAGASDDYIITKLAKHGYRIGHNDK